MVSKPPKYLSNAYLLQEIEKSKLSYCAYAKREHTKYDIIVKAANWDAITQTPDVIYRVVDYSPPPKLYLMKPFHHVLNGHVVLNSHQREGRLTEGLGYSLMLLVNRYSKNLNWRNYSYVEEMKSNALLQLVRIALRFDERLSKNPFSYLTQSTYNSFLQQLHAEKRQSAIRDSLIKELGLYQKEWRNED